MQSNSKPVQGEGDMDSLLNAMFCTSASWPGFDMQWKLQLNVLYTVCRNGGIFHNTTVTNKAFAPERVLHWIDLIHMCASFPHEENKSHRSVCQSYFSSNNSVYVEAMFLLACMLICVYVPVFVFWKNIDFLKEQFKPHKQLNL